jgi:predicted TPR repeat methyltransferase
LYAELLWITADHNAAAAAYDRILALDETNAKAWFLKGDSLQNAGRFEEAAIAHERAFSLGGDPSVGLLLSKKMRYLQQKKE